MIKKIIQKWDENKHLLQMKLEEGVEDGFGYHSLVSMIVEHVINHKEPFEQQYCTKFDNVNRDEYQHDDDINPTINLADNYRGDTVFIIRQLEPYDRSAENTIITHNGYGSCTGCDTLLRIIDDHVSYQCNGENTLLQFDSSGIEQLMTLSLHIIQRCHYLIDDISTLDSPNENLLILVEQWKKHMCRFLSEEYYSGNRSKHTGLVVQITQALDELYQMSIKFEKEINNEKQLNT